MPRAFLIKNKVRCAAPISAGAGAREDGGGEGERQEEGDHVQTRALTEHPVKPPHSLSAPGVPSPVGERLASFPPPGGAGGGTRPHEDPDPGDQPPGRPLHSNRGGPQSTAATEQPSLQGHKEPSPVPCNDGNIIEIKPQTEVLDQLEKGVPMGAGGGQGRPIISNFTSPVPNNDKGARNGEARSRTPNTEVSALEKVASFRGPGGGGRDDGGIIPHGSWVWWERAWSDLHGVRRQLLQGGQPPPPAAAFHPPPVPAASSSSWAALPEAVRRQECAGERLTKVPADGVVGRCIPPLPCRPQVFRPSPGRLPPSHPTQVWGGVSSMVLPPPHHLLSLPPPHLAALQGYHPALRPMGPHTGPLDPSTLVKFHSELARAQDLKITRECRGQRSGLERITSSLFGLKDRESRTNSTLKPDNLRTHALNGGDRNSSVDKIEPRPTDPPPPRQNQPWRSVVTEKVVTAGERRSSSEGQGRDLSQQGQGHDPLSRLKLEYGSRGEQEAPRRTMNPPRYQCEACNKSYATFSGLSKHKQFHCVSQVRKQFSCKFCDKMYVSLGALKMHIRTHTLPCKCQLCGKAFSRPWLLQGHVRTHTGEKPFQCAHCGRSFADRSNLRAHLQTHTDIKKYNCHVCSKTFSRMSLLLKHQDGGCPGSL